MMVLDPSSSASETKWRVQPSPVGHQRAKLSANTVYLCYGYCFDIFNIPALNLEANFPSAKEAFKCQMQSLLEINPHQSTNPVEHIWTHNHHPKKYFDCHDMW